MLSAGAVAATAVATRPATLNVSIRFDIIKPDIVLLTVQIIDLQSLFFSQSLDNQLEISGVSKVLSVSKESGQRPLSSFEQPSPGVDTLEVCDKAAARYADICHFSTRSIIYYYLFYLSALDVALLFVVVRSFIHSFVYFLSSRFPLSGHKHIL